MPNVQACGDGGKEKTVPGEFWGILNADHPQQE